MAGALESMLGPACTSGFKNMSYIGFIAFYFRVFGFAPITHDTSVIQGIFDFRVTNRKVKRSILGFCKEKLIFNHQNQVSGSG